MTTIEVVQGQTMGGKGGKSDPGMVQDIIRLKQRQKQSRSGTGPSSKQQTSALESNQEGEVPEQNSAIEDVCTSGLREDAETS